MKPIFALLLILILSATLMPDGAAYFPPGSGSNYCTAKMAVDSNGYSVIPAPTTGKTYYIASPAHGGSDSHDGLSGTVSGGHGPWATIGKAYKVLAHTTADHHVLLNKGDTWTETPAAYGATFNGLNCAHPFVIGSYGTGARPIIQCDVSVGNACFKAYTGADYVAYVGLEIYAYKRDPINNYANYYPNKLSTTLDTFLFQSGIHWTLIEDVKASYFYRQGITANALYGARGGTIELRKNVFTYGWFKYGGGNYFSGFNSIIEDGNIYAYGFANDQSFPITLSVTSPTVAEWTGNMFGNANGVALNTDTWIGIAENGNKIPSPLAAWYTFETGVSRPTYYAVNIGTCAGCTSTDQFNIATAPCATTSGCGSLVNVTSCTSPCSLSQSLVMLQTQGSYLIHTNYVQSSAIDTTTNVNQVSFTNNIFAFGGGDGACECVAGTFDNNLWFRNAIAVTIGKGNPIASLENIPSVSKNNVILESGPIEGYGVTQYPNTPPNPRGGGFSAGTQTGQMTITNNIVAHIGQNYNNSFVGIGVGGGSYNFMAVSTDAVALIAMIGNGDGPSVAGSQYPNPQMYEGAPVFFYDYPHVALPTGLGTSGDIFYIRNYAPYAGPFKKVGSVTYADITPSPVTISLANPACVTWPGNSVIIGSPVFFSTNGALPSHIGAANSTYSPNYYVIPAGFNSCNGAGSFEISASLGGAAINTSSDTQSGTQSAGSLITTTFNISTTPTGSLVGSLTCTGSCLTTSLQFSMYTFPWSVTGNVSCDWPNGIQSTGQSASIPGNVISSNTVNTTYGYTGNSANLAGIPNGSWNGLTNGCEGTWSGTGGNSNHSTPFPHPNLTPATYDADVLGNNTIGVNGATSCPGVSNSGVCGTEQHFLSIVTQLSKDNYNYNWTAAAVNEYIRAGFGMTYQ